jgi:tetratricopeptide (TPR) repeat protein
MNSQALIADDLSMLSRIYAEMDDSAQAKSVALEALQISRASKDPVTIAGALIHLGNAELILGDVEQASACFEEAYALCQAPDFRSHVYAGLACKGMGVIALGRHDYDRALEYLREGVRRAKITATQLEILNPLAGVIGTMPRRTTADVCLAAKIWGATQALNERMGTEITPSDRRRTDALITEARSRINPKTFAVAWAEGCELSLDEAIELAMA